MSFFRHFPLFVRDSLSLVLSLLNSIGELASEPCIWPVSLRDPPASASPQPGSQALRLQVHSFVREFW